MRSSHTLSAAVNLFSCGQLGLVLNSILFSKLFLNDPICDTEGLRVVIGDSTEFTGLNCAGTAVLSIS